MKKNTATPSKLKNPTEENTAINVIDIELCSSPLSSGSNVGARDGGAVDGENVSRTPAD